MGFTSSRRAILVCTDVAARGLDFPKIDWILQVQCGRRRGCGCCCYCRKLQRLRLLQLLQELQLL